MKKSIKEALNHPDKLGAGAKKRLKLIPKYRVEAVMAEYKRGTLNSGSGERAKSRQQAIAIALSEWKKKRKKEQ